MTTVDGATVIARSLADQGVEHMFGVLGVPVYGIAGAAEQEGIKFYAFRNEQAASYAAGVHGYLTGRPGVCLAVSGPGMIHAVAGLANAWANCWPMLLLGGANDSYQNGRGAFQEAPQLESARPYSKFVARAESIQSLPLLIEQGVRQSMHGRPGAAYLDLPGDLIFGEVDSQAVTYLPQCPNPAGAPALESYIDQALEVLQSAERPLVIIGKGAAYARSEDEVREFIGSTQLPFLPTPMGKGVMPDDHPLCVAAARSHALQNADVVFLLGARFNWILHFGLPPRFRKDVRVIQLDIAPEEIGRNVSTEVPLVGDARVITRQLNTRLHSSPWQFARESPWLLELQDRIAENRQTVEPMLYDDSVPMGYYRVLRAIQENIPGDAMVVSEGASTMDISRSVLKHSSPRHRLDAGTFGTMGIGLGSAIAAAVHDPTKHVIAVEGDSAFGFSGMEFEVACRFNLPITVVILNNNMGGGQRYVMNARYELMADAFGGKGYFVTTPDELERSLQDALSQPVPTILNVMIDHRSTRKAQTFNWLTR